MSRSKWWWRFAAALYVFINGGGAIYAAAMGEVFHMSVHAGLLVGGYLIWRTVRGPREVELAAFSDAKLEQLQQSVDAIALEVERIGEAQRFNTKLAAEMAEMTPPERRT